MRFEIPGEKLGIVEKPLTLWIASKVEHKFLSYIIFFIGWLSGLIVVFLIPQRRNLVFLTFKPEGI